jgi:pSer/pThr/pTyr-binding forkhead associated (FHA) protein
MVVSVKRTTGSASAAKPHRFEYFDEEVVVCGKQEGNALRLVTRHIARRHAQFERHGDRLVFHHNGSINGSFVNGQRFERAHQVRPGDALAIPDFDMRAALVPAKPPGRGWEPWLFAPEYFDRIWDEAD